MQDYSDLKILSDAEYTWLITGVAGFIGSNLLEFLLNNNQSVIGIDNFETGSSENLAHVQANVAKGFWKKFKFHEIDIE